MTDKPLAYSRLETDGEFRARLPAVEGVRWATRAAVELDDLAWERCKMQRRILWVE